jgi:hypothetical protein
VAAPGIDEKYPFLFDTLILDQLYSRLLLLFLFFVFIVVFFLDKYQKKRTILSSYSRLN